MRSVQIAVLSCVFFAAVNTARADDKPLDCRKRSLQDAVAAVDGHDVTIRFTGVCAGSLVIRTDGLTLQGVGPAIIEGGTQDAVTIIGASGVSLTHVEVRRSRNGIVASNGAHVSLQDVNSHDNTQSGITLQVASSVLLSDVIVDHNGDSGLALQTNSTAHVAGSFSASRNASVGISVTDSSIAFSQATVSANNNALGIQLAAGARAVMTDAATVITADNNVATGLALVSGAHLLNAGSTINTSGNVSGISVQDDSSFTLTNQARLVSGHNTFGIAADNGVGVTLVNSTVLGNTVKDIQLTFGTRADLRTLVVGTYACDATVLVRGTSGIVCPH